MLSASYVLGRHTCSGISKALETPLKGVARVRFGDIESDGEESMRSSEKNKAFRAVFFCLETHSRNASVYLGSSVVIELSVVRRSTGMS